MTSPLYIRLAKLDDAKILFDWRNDGESRRQSRTTAPVEWDAHMRWIESSLKDPSRVLCIAETEHGELIGTTRADFRDDGYTEVSYTVAPPARGKGFSKLMVLQFVREFLAARKIAADIKKDNAPSESVARALGLKPHHEMPSEDPEDPRPMVEWR